MSRPHVAHSFLEVLRQSRLLTPEQVDAALRPVSVTDETPAGELAHALVAEGLLTSWQAERLLRGRYRGFFIDHYRLLDVLGFGGMGVVYAAEDLQTGRKAALKVAGEAHRDDPGIRARLRLEARAGERLEHPRIVRTLRLGETHDVFDHCFLVMEYVEGITLPELIDRRGRCPWPQACDIIRQAAEGLDHAHRRGIVHRDVKPANFLIDREGRVCILDFGLALLSGEEDSEFSLAMIFGHDCLGTAEYMSPEQSLDSQSVDPRSDVYSLGATFYSVLTGRFPFSASSAAKTLDAQRTRMPRPVRQRVPDVPPEVEAVVSRMMAKRPEERFQSAAEVAAALEPFARREPVPFDFREVLAARLNAARRRLAAAETRRFRTRTTSTLTSRPGETRAVPRLPQAEDETFEPAAPEPQSEPAGGDDGLAPAVSEVAESLIERPASLPPGDLLVPLDGGPPIPLDRRRLLIGRQEGCDVQLASPGISGRHCELRFEAGWWKVVDLKSKNGVQVNGVAVAEQMLWPGDVLTLAGQHRFRFHGSADRPRRRPLAYAVLALLAAALGGAAVAWLW